MKNLTIIFLGIVLSIAPASFAMNQNGKRPVKDTKKTAALLVALTSQVTHEIAQPTDDDDDASEEEIDANVKRGRFDCAHPDCNNNNGNGFSTQINLNKHIQSIHDNIRFHCTHENCDNKNGQGFSCQSALKTHIASAHNGIRLHCPHQNCDDNNGQGFSCQSPLNMHIASVHNNIRFHCPHQNCDNKNGQGFLRHSYLQHHINTMHSTNNNNNNATQGHQEPIINMGDIRIALADEPAQQPKPHPLSLAFMLNKKMDE